MFEAVITIVDVPASNVRFVVVPIFHICAMGAVGKVHVPPPSLIVRVPLPEPENALDVADSVTLLLLTEKSSVPVNAPQVIDGTATVVLTVTVPPPELPSNVTASDVPGTDAPDEPPDDDAQCVVDDASHVPAPPTQNLFAIGQAALFLLSHSIASTRSRTNCGVILSQISAQCRHVFQLPHGSPTAILSCEG